MNITYTCIFHDPESGDISLSKNIYLRLLCLICPTSFLAETVLLEIFSTEGRSTA
jgi:hypothetical protein